MFEAQAELIFDSSIAVGVLGKGKDFILVRFGTKEGIDRTAVGESRAKGHQFCGVLGLTNGHAEVRCEPDADSVFTMMHAGLAFSQLVVEHLRSAPKGDAVEWLAALYRLPDTKA